MKSLTAAVLVLLLSSTPSSSQEAPSLRYSSLSGSWRLEMSQEIGVPDHPAIASRQLSFELDLEPGDEPSEIRATLRKAGGSYTAHGMEQRLSAGHLVGRTFTLLLADEGRRVRAAEPQGPPAMPVGAPVMRGLPVAEVLTEVLPQLPSGSVEAGAEWATGGEIHSLEGWSWGSGRLETRHRVLSVGRQGARTIVSVASEGQAVLEPLEAEDGYSGGLERVTKWQLDAAGGNLLLLEVDQTTRGTSAIPSGEVEVDQRTRLTLAPVSR